MRQPLPLVVFSVTALCASGRLAHGEALPPTDSDYFSLKAASSVAVESGAAGALRALVAGRYIAGGGAAGELHWGEWASLQLLDSATVCEPAGAGWQCGDVTLPEPVAWAAVAPSDAAVFVIGGIRLEGISARVSKWNPDGGAWTAEDLPELPLPLAWAGARVMDGKLFVAGGTGPQGDNRALLVLSLADTAAGWRAVPLLAEGESLLQPLLEVRKDERAIRSALYIFGGWRSAPEAPAGWVAATTVNKVLANEQGDYLATRQQPSPDGILLYDSCTLGPSHIIAAQASVAEIPAQPALLPRTGLPPARLARYHVFTDTWANFTAGLSGSVAFLADAGNKSLLMATAQFGGGEVLHMMTVEAVERHFSFLDYAVMFLYMLGLVWIGKYFANREKSTEDFFLGGRRIPWWAAGLSIYATGTSAISFMAIPAKTYATNWLYFIGLSIFPFFTMLIAAYVFVPLLRKLEITTVMEYFEMRFGRPIRFLLSAVAILGQVAGRMSITLLLPSIALSAVTGMNISFSILFMGVLATIYTAAGGISAVIWTDVLQVFVLFGGAILSFGLILMRVDGGFGGMITLALADDKFHFLDLRWDFTTATMWVMILWAVSDVFGKGLGQEGLQRAFSTKGVKEARRSMMTCAVVALPAGFLFYGIGTALYAFYHAHPEMLNPTLQTDAIFPLFIAQQLPAGLAGLVISGLFAASMSTLDTSMNTCATIAVRDFYSVWRKGTPEHEKLLVARIITIACGVLGTGIALYMASFENLGSLWDMFGMLLGVIGGGLGGIGVLALCTRRASTYGTLAGALVTAITMICIQRFTPVHFFSYGAISMTVGGLTGYVFSLLLPERRPKDLKGLTLWTR